MSSIRTKDLTLDQLMIALYKALSESEYSRIRGFDTTCRIEKSLETLHKGTSHARENKLFNALAEYVNFSMREKTIGEMNSRFICIIND